MPESLPPDLQTLLERCQQFAREVLLTQGDRAPENARQAVRAAAQAAGLYAMTQPREVGGTAAGQLALCVARETLAAHNPPYLDAVFGPGPGVLAAVPEPLRSSHLLPLLAGDLRGSFGFTEPDDAPHPTRGTLVGDSLLIEGQKSYVTGGADADFINTLVHVEGRGPSMVVIDKHLDGVVMTHKFASLDGSHHAAFEFQDVRVPAAHIVGEAGQGLPRAMQQIGDTRLLLAAQASGYMLWMLELLTAHLQAPDKSGQPRGSKDVVRLRYADLRIKAFAARSMLYRTARLADRGENIVNEAMACKVFATESVDALVDTAIQLVGGGALVEGHPLERLYRRVRVWRLAEGASDVLRLNIGRGILDLGKGRI